MRNRMGTRQTKLRLFAISILTASLMFTAALTFAKGQGRNANKQDDDDGPYYGEQERRAINEWYADHASSLPPGLAKRDRLPPGLEKQLVRRGTLPPGLEKRIEPCPPDLDRYLPPPPPDCAHVLIGGHIVLLNRKTNVVVDFLHVELF